MSSLLPIIPISLLQRSARKALGRVEDYAVVRSHSKDVAFVLHPHLGEVLLRSGMLEELRKIAKCKSSENESVTKELERLIGQVLRELSKK